MRRKREANDHRWMLHRPLGNDRRSTETTSQREREREREPEFCAFFAGRANRRSQSPSHNPVKVTTAIESEELRLNGNKWGSINHSLFQLPQPQPQPLSLPLSAVPFSPKAAYRIDVTRRLLHTCGEMTVRAARVGAGTGRGGRRRRCRGHRGSVDELEGGGGRVSDEGAETVDVGVGGGGERALSVRATQVHPGSCKHRHLSRFCDPREEIPGVASGSPKSGVVASYMHATRPVRNGRPRRV